MSLTGWAGGVVALPDTGCWLSTDVWGGVVGFLFTGADGTVVMHREVQHMIIRIKTMIILFMGITMVNITISDLYDEMPFFYNKFCNFPLHFSNYIRV
jgi:hypothetical protein